MKKTANFAIGDVVHHRLFDYRGVIYDVDPSFLLSEEWYEEVAKSRPPKDEPWFRILVHNGIHETYVAERNLEACTLGEPVSHPLVHSLFDDFADGHYQAISRAN